ncbi:MAG: cysteine--tRNA ligase [Clostridia bacterium]|nr:cysteine--tRNA ligase [Clostridia bacterium]
MKIYNTLTKSKEDFIPINGNKVSMYACGITVSGEAHIGHAYQALIYDIMRKFLIKQGYDVTYARNYTDVDDKIIAKSHETGIPADKYAEMMIEKINSVMAKMKVDDPDVWLKATENIDNIIDFVNGLIEKGHAYPTKNGDVYFDVESYPAYGALSNRNLEDALNGVRIDNDEEKKSPLDFALWKSAKPGEISWDSPWGKGRPGWHIECSAMNRQAFGDSVDIHGGGRDLIFPHHENEIAQSEALTGKKFVKYWTHNGLIKVNGQKMSKSLGNSIVLTDLLDEFSHETVKFALLSTNYKNDINITDNLFTDAENHLYGFYKIIEEVAKRGENSGEFNNEIDKEFDAAMSDDFNTALALSNLFGYFKKIKAKLNANDLSCVADVNQIVKTYSLLGIFTEKPEDFIAFVDAKNPEDAIPDEVYALCEERKQAKKNKDFALADTIRAKITELGYTVKDTREGYSIEKITQ